MLSHSEKLEAFSEGLFAIAATIGVETLADLNAQDLAHGYSKLVNKKINDFFYSLCVYGLICIVRKQHIYTYRYISFVNNTIVAVNFIDLLAACLLPFAINGIHHHPHSHVTGGVLAGVVALFHASQLAVIFYARHRGLWRLLPAHDQKRREETDADESEYAINPRPEEPSPEEAFRMFRMRLLIGLVYCLFCIVVIALTGNYGSK